MGDSGADKVAESVGFSTILLLFLKAVEASSFASAPGPSVDEIPNLLSFSFSTIKGVLILFDFLLGDPVGLPSLDDLGSSGVNLPLNESNFFQLSCE